MANILSNVLKVNQPLNNGFDNNTVRNNPIVPSDSQIQNIVDPSKVVRPDGKPETEDKQFAYASESNYGTFVKNLREMPFLAEMLSKILVMDASTMITSGLNTDFAAQVARFMEMMKMDPQQLLSFLKDQSASSGKFGGVFFQALRDVLNNTGSLELRTSILDFLKHYSDMASSDHLLRNIMAELNEMKPFMFKNDAAELEALKNRLILPEDGEKTGRLQTGENAAKDQSTNQVPQQNGQKLTDAADELIRQNGRLIREEMIPFFSKYITKTKDLGRIRDIMTLITLNTARYMNGSKESVIQSFEKLLKFTDFRNRLGEIKEENLEGLLNRMLQEQKDGEAKPFTEQFLDLIRSGLKGEGGYESKMVFQNLMNAMLLNESVYMPLLHIMLPINLDGNMIFSEMWIDPDAAGSGNGELEEEKRSIRMLIKFDIKDLGFFDVVINYHGGDVDLAVAYPPRLAPMEKNIRTSLGRIVADNGLSFQSINLEQGRTPIQLMDVFPKITEGRNSVNVRI